MTDRDERVPERTYDTPEKDVHDSRAHATGDVGQRELGIPAKELEAGRFANGDPIPTSADVSHQKQPQVTELHVLKPVRDSADEDKAPTPVQVIAPQRRT